MEHGNGANFSANESWGRDRLWAIFKLRKLPETLAHKAEEKKRLCYENTCGALTAGEHTGRLDLY